MERKVRQNLGGDCGRSDVLSQLKGPDAGRIAHYLEEQVNCPVYGNTRTTYYPLGDDCYRDLLAAIQSARQYVFIEYFIIEEGKLWNSVLQVLKEKVKEGVEVRVIYDDVGSIFTCRQTIQAGWKNWGFSAGCSTGWCRLSPCARTTGTTGNI